MTLLNCLNMASRSQALSLSAFCAGILPCAFYMAFDVHNLTNYFLYSAIYTTVINLSIFYVFKQCNFTFEVQLFAGSLGFIFAIGIVIGFLGSQFSLFGCYLSALAFFHWSEYYMTALTNPSSLSVDSFLLNHSTEYHVAVLASCLEFVSECWIFPAMKGMPLLNFFGLVMVIVGEFIRKLGMLTAGRNFHHLVQQTKLSDHCLVTWGIYRLFRHPAYVGWFYWSLGTQIMLCNPICAVVYAVVSWQFFSVRIYREESLLVDFFGVDYIEYQQKVATGLPFIKGCIIPKHVPHDSS